MGLNAPMDPLTNAHLEQRFWIRVTAHEIAVELIRIAQIALTRM
jgi:hypothetical protein